MSTFLDLEYSAPTTIESRTRVFRGMTLNRKTQVNHSDAQTWAMSIGLAPTAGREDDPAPGRLAAHYATHGTFESFTINMPQHVGVAGAIEGTVSHLQTNGVTAAGETEVAVDTTSTVTLPAGLFITIGSDKKVYMVSEKVTLAASDTNPVVKVYPPLVQATVDNNGFDVTPTIDVFYSESQAQGVTYSDGLFVNAVISVEEALA